MMETPCIGVDSDGQRHWLLQVLYLLFLTLSLSPSSLPPLLSPFLLPHSHPLLLHVQMIITILTGFKL